MTIPLPPPGGAGWDAVDVSGILSVAGGRDQRCSARIAAHDRILITSEQVNRRGEALLCRLEKIGLIPGWVGPAAAAGFILVPDYGDARRDRVAARLAWLMACNREADRRDAPRIVPLHRQVVVRFADDIAIEGDIDDLSLSGVRVRFAPSLTLHRMWLPGAAVTVGKRHATVVRTEPDTIAARFRLPFTQETFNPSVII